MTRRNTVKKKNQRDIKMTKMKKKRMKRMKRIMMKKPSLN